MRQLAWLNAVPLPPPGSRRAEAEKHLNRPSRLDGFKKDKIPAPLPVNPAPHITGRLIAMGLVQPAGMGTGPLTWAEIAAWQQNMCVRLAPWEAALLRTLSAAYIAEGRRAEAENASPPWQWPITQREIDNEIAALEALFAD